MGKARLLDVADGYRLCKECRNVKPVSEFYDRVKHKTNTCKMCENSKKPKKSTTSSKSNNSLYDGLREPKQVFPDHADGGYAVSSPGSRW